MKGIFVTIEGADGSGKSTQAKKVVESLGNSAVHYVFPDRTSKSGEKINQFLKGELDIPARQVHELFFQNRAEASEKMKADISTGKTVVADRYRHSGAAYAKVTAGFSQEECDNLDDAALIPDIVILLDIDPELASARRNDYGTEAFEKIELQQKIRNEFIRMSNEDKTVNWLVLDSSRSQEEISGEIISYIHRYEQQRRR
ncbi:thymidylate kinase [Tetraselmis virus 1]|uniref:dTMP kinase n=1 Tax=Tetraselmis virus 1 TaxID=2060617 RepID=A0A2P0VN24_9VIRU|nr:thymidylate kinase [Tetraselmis virus 1]AUF82317.1 thymidylate kinase [Tetraselmis virus 1]